MIHHRKKQEIMCYLDPMGNKKRASLGRELYTNLKRCRANLYSFLVSIGLISLVKLNEKGVTSKWKI